MFFSAGRDRIAPLVCALGWCLPFYAQAIPGTLDLSFGAPVAGGGNKGWNVANFGSGDTGKRIALQADGSIVVAGNCQTPTLFDFCLTRFTSAGLLDTTFGTSGLTTTQLSVGDDFLSSIAMQSDGKILVAGSCDAGGRRAFCAARYSSNGSIDASFADNGIFIQAIGNWSSSAQAVAITSNGQVLLAGVCNITASVYSFCALRLNADGSADSTGFGTNGVFILPGIGVASDILTGVALQSDGKAVLVGYCSNGSAVNFCLARINPAGALDTSFRGSGKFFEFDSVPAYAQDVKLQSDGKIVVAGYCIPDTFGYDFCVRRYATTGQADTGFGSGGGTYVAITNVEDFAAELAIAPDGKIVVAGHCRNPVNSPADYDFCLVRLTPTGTLDSTFANGGRIARNISGFEDRGRSVALQPDGKILVGGGCNGSSDIDFCIARFLGDAQSLCKLDIDGDGAVLAAIDGVLLARIAGGFTGDALVGGITFPPNASRTSAASVNAYLQSICNGCEIDIDGDGVLRLGVDSLILIRAALLLPGTQVMAGVTLPAGATRRNWPTIRTHLNDDCGMNAQP